MAEQHDATLMVQLAQWGSTMGVEEALQHLWAEDFDPAAATVADPMVLRILNYGETIGTLTKNGLFDTALALDWLWVAGIWARVAPAAEKFRKDLEAPELYENFEALAKQQQ